MKAEHYNDMHPDEEQLKVVFNFTDDVEEMKIANGLEDRDEAA